MAQADRCACPGCEECAGYKPCPRPATESDNRCRPCHEAERARIWERTPPPSGGKSGGGKAG